MMVVNNAIILARVSSKAQEDEGYSLDSQLKLLTHYCDQHALKVEKIFKIAETASKDQSRKVFHEMLTYLHNNGVCHLLVEKTDRLTRNFRDAVAIDDWLEADAARHVHAVKENLLLHKEAKSDVKFMWNIHLSVAKKYTDNLREEAMKGWAEKLAQGWLPSSPPPGYKTVSEHGKRIHVPNPDTWPLMKKVFELYLEPDQSIKSVAGEMERMGITTSKGRPYYKSQVQRILTNPFYIGINKFDGKEYPGAQQTLISRELFQKVQQKLSRGRPMKYIRHNPVFKNMIECSDCLGKLTWQLQKGRYYGKCQQRNTSCRGKPMMREDKLEDNIATLLHGLVSPSKEIVEWVKAELANRSAEAHDRNENIKSSTLTQLNRIKRMEENLYDDKLAGEISKEVYELKRTQLHSQKADLESQLTTLDKDPANVARRKITLLDLSQKAARIYRSLSPEQKRLVMIILFEKIEYKGGVISVNYTKFSQSIVKNVRKSQVLVGGAK